MSVLLDVLWQSLQAPLAADDIRAAVGALAFVTSFLTYILATVITRRVYIRLQRQAYVNAAILIASLVLSIAELVAPISPFGISNFLLKLAFGIWTVGLVWLIPILGGILSTDRIIFKKPKASRTFAPFQDITNNRVYKFGLGCVDHYLEAATHGKTKRRLFFPILLIAEKCFRPWRFAAEFAVAGLADDKGGVIYFAFNQPADIVVDQLARRFVNMVDPKQEPKKYWNPQDGKAPKSFESVRVIDCHSKWLEEKARPPHTDCQFTEAHNQVKVLLSDPRDPFDLSQKYKRAMEELLDNDIRSVRVVYDSISDFLVYSDPQLTVQFVKHNMVWEDQMKVSSLYVYIPNVPQSVGENLVDENFLRWNSNCVVRFEHKEEVGQDIMTIEGLFDETTCDRVERMEEWNYRIVPSQSSNTQAAGNKGETESTT